VRGVTGGVESATVNVAVALLPVLLFLGLLVFLDSFKLVALRSVLVALVAGALAALAGTELNGWLLATTGMRPALFSRYAAPPVEEALKALWVVLLVRRGRVGFLVDAAILGFAVGAGFALVENVEYLRALSERRLGLWLVRGLGTAVLHGATTAIFAILAKGLSDRHPDRPLLALAPGWLVVVAVHSVYNHFLLPPLLAALVLLVALPLLVIVVFERSERRTRDWLGLGLDTDLELVETIVSGRALETRIGAYLSTLKTRFPGEVVADMLCLLQIQAELAIRAKGLLLAREAGLEAPVGEDVRGRLAELRYLEASIGRTGLLALKPVLRQDARSLWQVYLLEEAGRSSGPST
jgi:RsiW-degrading membrane proteinase PrsW (M82 family)